MAMTQTWLKSEALKYCLSSASMHSSFSFINYRITHTKVRFHPNFKTGTRIINGM